MARIISEVKEIIKEFDSDDKMSAIENVLGYVKLKNGKVGELRLTLESRKDKFFLDEKDLEKGDFIHIE